MAVVTREIDFQNLQPEQVGELLKTLFQVALTTEGSAKLQKMTDKQIAETIASHLTDAQLQRLCEMDAVLKGVIDYLERVRDDGKKVLSGYLRAKTGEKSLRRVGYLITRSPRNKVTWKEGFMSFLKGKGVLEQTVAIDNKAVAKLVESGDLRSDEVERFKVVTTTYSIMVTPVKPDQGQN